MDFQPCESESKYFRLEIVSVLNSGFPIFQLIFFIYLIAILIIINLFQNKILKHSNFKKLLIKEFLLIKLNFKINCYLGLLFKIEFREREIGNECEKLHHGTSAITFLISIDI